MPTKALSKKQRRRRIVTIILSCLILLVAATAVYVFVNRQQSQQVATASCSGQTAADARAALTSGDAESLIKSASAIKLMPAYESDITCLYIVTEGDIALGDIGDAEVHNKQLQLLAKNGESLDKALDSGIDLIKITNDAVVAMRATPLQTNSEGDGPVEGKRP